MLLRIFVTLIVLVALIVGLLSFILPPIQVVSLLRFRDIFDATLPILAFAALIKYLFTFKCRHRD